MDVREGRARKRQQGSKVLEGMEGRRNRSGGERVMVGVVMKTTEDAAGAVAATRGLLALGGGLTEELASGADTTTIVAGRIGV